MSKPDQNSKQTRSRKIVKWMWILAIFGVAAAFMLFTALSFANLPTFEDLENPRQNVASEVYYSDQSLLGRYYIENRVIIPYDDLNPNLIRALVSTEDKRYFKHSGIDYRALGRVAIKTVILGNSGSGGGSTITQQLAKLLYDRPDMSGKSKLTKATILVITKLKEWITAVKLEKAYTKEEIIAMYLNHFDFLNQSFGIQAASETYFGKNQENLNIEEAAALIGMLKNPWLYNPVRRPEEVINRRMVVLKQMELGGFISQAVYDSLKVRPLDMSNFNRSSHTKGDATYFRMEMRKEVKEILSRKECLKPDGTPYNIDRDGLRIYTTLDGKIQKHAEASVLSKLPEVQQTFFRHWNEIRENPWEYDEDKSNVELKMANLRAQMRNSGRYQNIRATHLAPELLELTENNDIQLTDTDILRLLEIRKSRSALDRYRASPNISDERISLYKALQEKGKLAEISNLWDTFQQTVDEEFSKPISMKVFTYDSPTFEKDTVMSPLDSIMYHRKHLQVGVLAIDPVTGQVKAWVGGINMKYYQQDHIFTNRQVGSTFKPFLYAAAIAHQGISPCFKVDDVQWTISRNDPNFGLPQDWSPKNSDDEYFGEPITLYEALRKSKNTISAYLIKQIGSVQPVIQIAQNLGINREKLPEVPSIVLGTPDLSLFEMTAAYSTFANNGVYNKPFFIQRIEDKNGRVIFREIGEERRALQEEANYVVVDMLKYAGIGAKNSVGLRSEFGGKTGTTQNHSDAWFMGITPSLVVGTWVGGEDRWIRFRNIQLGSGARMARPIVLDLFSRLEADSNVDFDIDASFHNPQLKNITIDCDLYERLNPQQDQDGFETDQDDEFF